MKKLKLFVISFLIFLSTSCIEQDNSNQILIEQVNQIDNFIAVNHPSDFVFYDQSGIRFVVKKFGDFPPAKAGQILKIDITGKVLNSETNFQDEEYLTKVEDISVEGLRFVISNTMIGSQIIAYIPSQYAFGKDGEGNVPGNSVIVYNFEIKEVTTTISQLNQLEIDTLAILDFLAENQITNVNRHPSGIYYKISNTGAGSSPHVYKQVTFTYDGKLLATQNTFDDGRISSLVFNLVDGLKVVLPKMRVGDNATIFIPSLYGYGASATSNIPANSILIFDVTLESVFN